MSDTLEFYDTFVAQSTNEPPLKPEVPSKFDFWVKHGQGTLIAPCPPCPATVQRCPSLVEICSKQITPTFKFEDVVLAILHFVRAPLNDARRTAKIVMQSHLPSRVRFLCAIAEAQSARDALHVLPAGFPEIVALEESSAPEFFRLSKAQQNREHDVCKIRIAVHLLTSSRPDTDFPNLAVMLSDCKVPSMQNVLGMSRFFAQRIMHHIVTHEVRKTGMALVACKMWMVTVDGAHKKAMRGAPDVIKGRIINMETGGIAFRHLGLITHKRMIFFILIATLMGASSVLTPHRVPAALGPIFKVKYSGSFAMLVQMTTMSMLFTV